MKCIKYPIALTLAVLWFSSCSLRVNDNAGATMTGNTGKIAGVVTAPPSHGLSKSMVSATDFYADVYLYRETLIMQLKDSMRTDSSGTFAFDSLPAGTYRVRAQTSFGEELESAELVLASDQTLQVTLTSTVSSSSSSVRDTTGLTRWGFPTPNTDSIVQITGDSLVLKGILRDFQANHPDFELYDARALEISVAPIPGSGYSPFTFSCFSSYNPTANPEYWSCENGQACSSSAPQAFFGLYHFKWNNQLVSVKTLRHHALAKAQEIIPEISGTPTVMWEEPVYINRNMVTDSLQGDAFTSPLDWKPVKAMTLCHNSLFEQWWNNDSSSDYSKILPHQLVLRKPQGKSYYEYDSDQDPKKNFFPLDDAPVEYQFAERNLNLWCPPYGPLSDNGLGPCGSFESWKCPGGHGEAGPNNSIAFLTCQDLLSQGGPKSSQAVQNAVAENPGADTLLHNANFTANYALTFAYNTSNADTLWFESSNDLWVFIDGKLALDMGGANQLAEGRLALSQYAITMGWQNDSPHYLHIFTANRMSFTSRFLVRLKLHQLAVLK